MWYFYKRITRSYSFRNQLLNPQLTSQNHSNDYIESESVKILPGAGTGNA